MAVYAEMLLDRGVSLKAFASSTFPTQTPPPSPPTQRQNTPSLTIFFSSSTCTINYTHNQAPPNILFRSHQLQYLHLLAFAFAFAFTPAYAYANLSPAHLFFKQLLQSPLIQPITCRPRMALDGWKEGHGHFWSLEANATMMYGGFFLDCELKTRDSFSLGRGGNRIRLKSCRI